MELQSKSPSQRLVFFNQIFAGSFAIGISRTVVAPIERVKLIIQTTQQFK